MPYLSIPWLLSRHEGSSAHAPYFPYIPPPFSIRTRAYCIGMTKPICCAPSFLIATETPTTRPKVSKTGPPLLPGLSARAVCHQGLETPLTIALRDVIGAIGTTARSLIGYPRP